MSFVPEILPTGLFPEKRTFGTGTVLFHRQDALAVAHPAT